VAGIPSSRADLEKLLQEARELTQQQAVHQAAKQDSSKRLQTLMVEGAKLATVIRGGLKSHYGSRSEKLTELGVQPFRGRQTKEKPADRRRAPRWGRRSPGSDAAPPDGGVVPQSQKSRRHLRASLPRIRCGSLR
jgi:hypothetical protein